MPRPSQSYASIPLAQPIPPTHPIHSEDRTFKVWDLGARCLLYTSAILSSSPLLSLALDARLPRAAIGSADGKVRFIDLAHPAFRCLHTLDAAAYLRREEAKQLAIDAQKRATSDRELGAVVISGASSHHAGLKAARGAAAGAGAGAGHGSIILGPSGGDAGIGFGGAIAGYRAIDEVIDGNGNFDYIDELDGVGRSVLSLAFLAHSDASAAVGGVSRALLGGGGDSSFGLSAVESSHTHGSGGSGSSNALPRAPSTLVVCTSYAILVVDSGAQNVCGALWLTQEHMLRAQQEQSRQQQQQAHGRGGAARLGQLEQIGFVGRAAVAERSDRAQQCVDIVIASAFAPALSMIEMNFAPPQSAAVVGRGADAGGSAAKLGSVSEHDDDESGNGDDDGGDDEDDDAFQLDDDEESDEAKSSTNHPSADALASISVFACDDEDVPEASPLRRHEFAPRANGMLT